MSDIPELFVYEVTHNVIDEGTGEYFGSTIGTREPTVAEVVVWLREREVVECDEEEARAKEASERSIRCCERCRASFYKEDTGE